MDIKDKVAAYTAKLKEQRDRAMTALKMQQSGKSLKEIGEHFGVSRERARQLVAKAIQEGAPNQ